jgi:serine protease Do
VSVADSVLTVEGVETALAEVAERVSQVTVHVRTGSRSAGAGVMWLRSGLVVTNAHVATGNDAEVVLPDGRVVRARLLARDPRRDLAALALPREEHAAALRIDARGLRPGELVIAVGHPLGVAYATALGIVHRAPGSGRGPAGWLQADIRLAPGNSGGPLADASGRIVGINAMIVGGLGLAVPTHIVERFVQDAERARVGVRAA